MSIERFAGGVTVRPMSGLPKFKRTACVQLKDGAISATNRWGKTRSFPLSGAENSPKRAGGAFNSCTNVWWLEDEGAKLLLVVEMEHFWDVEMGDLVRSTNLPMPVLSDHMFPMRPDVFKVSDLPIVNFGIYSAAVGSAAVALNWLHLLPEWLFLLIAVPTLIAAFICVAGNKLTGPKGKDKEHQGYLLRHQDELFAEAEKGLDELEQSLPDSVKEAKPAPGAANLEPPPEEADGA